MKKTLMHNARRAFTLLEVLMSAFVLALGSLGLLALFAGAASQQQAAIQLTDSVTLSKNAEALIRAKVEGFGTDARLGCTTPVFSQDAWYALPANQDYGYLTINPTNDPDTGALFIEEDARGGENITLYRARAFGSSVILGGGSSEGVALPPFNAGSPALDFQLRDRRLLLRAQSPEDDLTVTFTYYQIGCEMGNGQILLQERSPIQYQFAGNCSTASTNVVFLGQRGARPTSIDDDHVRINTETIPVDGFNLARLIGFRVTDIERPDQQVAVCVDPLTGFITGSAPECRTAEDANCHLVYSLDASGLAPGRQIYKANDFAGADLTLLPSDPRTSPDGYTRLVGLRSAPDGVDDGNNTSIQLQPGTRVPRGMTPPSGPFVVETALATGSEFYSFTPETVGQPSSGTISALLYPSKIVTEIQINYKRRADELISLSDRVSYSDDENYRNGRRPNMAYSVLYRDRGGRASDQFVVFTYSLTPGRTDADWFPPETADDINEGLAPLRRAQGVNLRYEEETDRWLLILNTQNGDNEWMARTGQLLLFAGVGRSGGDIAGPGAESAVRVVGVDRRNNDRIFLTLDGPPRAGGANLLQVHYGDDDTGEFDVWGIQPTVRSASDDSLWKLEAIEARAFQAGGGS